MILRLIAMFIFAVNVFGYINISPTNFNKRIDEKGSTTEYHLYNPTKKTIKYDLSLSDEDFSKSMKDWIEIYPKTVTLRPRESKSFKVYIRSPKGVPKGEYLSTIEVKEKSIVDLEKKKENGVQILTHLKMDIVGYVGDISPKIFPKNISLENINNRMYLKGELANIGERRGTFDVYLESKNGKESFYLGKIKILKNQKFNLSELVLSENIKDNNYNFILRDVENNKVILEKEI